MGITKYNKSTHRQVPFKVKQQYSFRHPCIRSCLIRKHNTQGQMGVVLAEYIPIVYDRDDGEIANNLKPIGTVIVSVERKSISSIQYFELFAYFSETLLILSY